MSQDWAIIFPNIRKTGTLTYSRSRMNKVQRRLERWHNTSLMKYYWARHHLQKKCMMGTDIQRRGPRIGKSSPISRYCGRCCWWNGELSIKQLATMHLWTVQSTQSSSACGSNKRKTAFHRGSFDITHRKEGDRQAIRNERNNATTTREVRATKSC